MKSPKKTHAEQCIEVAAVVAEPMLNSSCDVCRGMMKWFLSKEKVLSVIFDCVISLCCCFSYIYFLEAR